MSTFTFLFLLIIAMVLVLGKYTRLHVPDNDPELMDHD
jgi:hypothetical protein